MLHWADYLKIFMALLIIVNPVSALPLFVSMTACNTETEKKNIARIASFSVAVVLVLAALIGQPILAIFGITIASFKVGGVQSPPPSSTLRSVHRQHTLASSSCAACWWRYQPGWRSGSPRQSANGWGKRE
jgi:hypothetical protein